MKKRMMLLVLAMVMFTSGVVFADSFDVVEKMLRNGIQVKNTGVYNDGASLCKDLVKGKYVYCFTTVAHPVRYSTTKTTSVVMWKEHYDRAKGPGNGKNILWVCRWATGQYEKMVEGMIRGEICSYKEAILIADVIVTEAGIK